MMGMGDNDCYACTGEIEEQAICSECEESFNLGCMSSCDGVCGCCVTAKAEGTE